jgi:hypothetical protein
MMNLPFTESGLYVLPLSESSLFPGSWQTQLILKLLKVNPEAAQESLRDLPGFIKPPQTPPAAPHTGHLQTQRILVRKLPHIPYVPLTHVHSYIQHLVLHKSPFKNSSKENPAQSQLK